MEGYYVLAAPRMTTTGVLLFVVFSVFLSLTHGQDVFYLNMKPTNQDVVERSETKLYCDVNDRRHIVFQWMQNGKPLENTTRKYQEDSNLRIMRVLRGMDDGPFQCIATNVTTGFSLQSQEALLNIQWIDKQSSVVLRRPGKSEVQVGANITLRCQVSGNPEPTIRWYNNRFRLFTTGSIKISGSGARLKLTNVTATHNGVISCSAENMAGDVDSQNNFLLNVQAPGYPRLLEDQFTPYKLVMKNKPARIDCPFDGASRINWFSKYDKLSNSSRHQVFPNGSLYFPKVMSSDGGSYRCEGLVTSSPKLQAFTVQLVLSVSPVPSKPRITHISNRRATSFNVNWEPPLVTNGKLISYKVRWSHNGNSKSRVIMGHLTNPMTAYIMDLTPDTSYVVQVAAATNGGYGPFTDNFPALTDVTEPTCPCGLPQTYDFLMDEFCKLNTDFVMKVKVNNALQVSDGLQLGFWQRRARFYKTKNVINVRNLQIVIKRDGDDCCSDTFQTRGWYLLMGKLEGQTMVVSYAFFTRESRQEYRRAIKDIRRDHVCIRRTMFKIQTLAQNLIKKEK